MNNNETIKVDIILKTTSKILGDVDFFEQKNRRLRQLFENRAIAFKMLRKYTRLSLEDIGNIFEKNHATILHGIKLCDNLTLTDKFFRETKIIPIINKLNEILPAFDDDFVVPNPYETIKNLSEKNAVLLNALINERGKLFELEHYIISMPTIHKKYFKDVRFFYNTKQKDTKLEMVQEQLSN